MSRTSTQILTKHHTLATSIHATSPTGWLHPICHQIHHHTNQQPHPYPQTPRPPHSNPRWTSPNTPTHTTPTCIPHHWSLWTPTSTHRQSHKDNIQHHPQITPNYHKQTHQTIPTQTTKPTNTNTWRPPTHHTKPPPPQHSYPPPHHPTTSSSFQSTAIDSTQSSRKDTQTKITTPALATMEQQVSITSWHHHTSPQ